MPATAPRATAAAATATPTGPPIPEDLPAGQRRRRDRIVDAALHRLLTEDYAKIKVTDVAEDAGVALGTLYRYFSSKEHLFAAAFQLWQSSLKQHLERSALRGETNSARMQDLMNRMLRAFQAQPQLYKVMLVMQTSSDPYAGEIYDRLEARFEEFMEPGLGGVPEAHRHAMVRTLAAALDDNLRAWVMNRRTFAEAHRRVLEAVQVLYEYRE